MATSTVTETVVHHNAIRLEPVGGEPCADAEPPVTQQHAAYSQWKLSKGTLLKVISAGFSFFVAGVNDGSIGALLPYIIREYKINTAIVSVVYVLHFLC